MMRTKEEILNRKPMTAEEWAKIGVTPVVRSIRQRPSSYIGTGPEAVRREPASTPLVGDALKETLESYGVTVEWWQGIKKEYGLPPTCDCPERQAWLNRASEKHPILATAGVAFLRAIRRRGTSK